MGAKTFATTPGFHNAGDNTIVDGNLTAVADGDTLDVKTQCGLGIIRQAIFTPTTAVVAIPSFASGGTTITFKIASGSIAGRLMVIGI